MLRSGADLKYVYLLPALLLSAISIFQAPEGAMAASIESPESVAKFHRRPIDLSAGADQLATIMGIDDDLASLKSMSGGSSSLEMQVQSLMARQRVIEDLLTQSFEVRACLAEVDQEVAEAEDLQAYLENRRDKAIRLNTIANFLSGGVTGIVGGSMSLGGVDSRVENSIDTGEGIIQASLALLALKQQNGERHLMEGVPNKLARVLGLTPSKDFPPNIWKYLNSPPPGLKESRRDIMVDHWKKSGMIEKARPKGIREKLKGIPPQEHLAHLAGSHNQVRISIDLLDARSAMLTDLRASISEMDVYLSEILQDIRRIR